MSGNPDWRFADPLEAMGWQATFERMGMTCSRVRVTDGWQLIPGDQARALELYRDLARHHDRQNETRRVNARIKRERTILRAVKIGLVALGLMYWAWLG